MKQSPWPGVTISHLYVQGLKKTETMYTRTHTQTHHLGGAADVKKQLNFYLSPESHQIQHVPERGLGFQPTKL